MSPEVTRGLTLHTQIIDGFLVAVAFVVFVCIIRLICDSEVVAGGPTQDQEDTIREPHWTFWAPEAG